jgi:predicted acetyltransferase
MINSFEFTFESDKESHEDLNSEIRPIVLEGLFELFKLNNEPTEGKDVDVQAHIIDKKPIDNGKFSYTVEVKVTRVTEEAEYTE